MNIFVVSPDPEKCASCLDNRRLNKMIVETAQLLSTTLWEWDHWNCIHVYRPSHVNHPVNKWVRQNREHYSWTLTLFAHLLQEWEYRQFNPHRSGELLPYFREVEQEYRANKEPEWFQNSSAYKDMDVFEAYKQTLRDKWENENPDWGRRGPPEWL